jgi:hypothetical protein
MTKRGKSSDQEALIEFFNNEGYRLGYQGDLYGWTPTQTAIVAMKELMKLEPMVALPQIPNPK